MYSCIHGFPRGQARLLPKGSSHCQKRGLILLAFVLVHIVHYLTLVSCCSVPENYSSIRSHLDVRTGLSRRQLKATRCALELT